MFYLNNKFVPIDVSRWKEKLHCTVNVGIGSGSQQTKMKAMSSIMQILGTLVQQGGMGTLVSPDNLYNAISEYIEQSGYKNADTFISNPRMMPPKQPPQPTPDEKIASQKAMLEVEKLKLQAAEMQVDAQIKQQELEIKKTSAAVDLALKQKELELKQSQLVLNESELELERQQKRPVGIGPK